MGTKMLGASVLARTPPRALKVYKVAAQGVRRQVLLPLPGLRKRLKMISSARPSGQIQCSMVCVCVCVCVHAHTTHTPHTHSLTLSRTHTHVSIYIYMRIHIHTRIRICIYIHTCIHTYIHTYIQVYHTHTYMYRHTYIYTHIHIGVSECVCQEGFVEVEGQGCVPSRGGAGSAATDPHQQAQVLKSPIYS